MYGLVGFSISVPRASDQGTMLFEQTPHNSLLPSIYQVATEEKITRVLFYLAVPSCLVKVPSMGKLLLPTKVPGASLLSRKRYNEYQTIVNGSFNNGD